MDPNLITAQAATHLAEGLFDLAVKLDREDVKKWLDQKAETLERKLAHAARTEQEEVFHALAQAELRLLHMLFANLP